MPYRGPSTRGEPAALTAFNLRRDLEKDDFARRMDEQSQARQIGNDFARNVEDFRRREDTREAGIARNVMTPGVRRGGMPPRMRSVADSPLMQSSTSQFQQHGETFSYDPQLAAEDEAGGILAQEEAKNRAERQRIGDLQEIPGITPRMASRMVLGRAIDENPDELRRVLEEYVRSPSRESAARAIGAGADLNKFPDRFMLGDDQTPPVRGTPAYEQMLEREDRMRTEHDIEADERRLRMAATLRPEPRDRYRSVKGPRGEIGRQDLDTGEVEWSGQMGAPPTTTTFLKTPAGAAGGAAPAPAGGGAPSGGRRPIISDDAMAKYPIASGRKSGMKPLTADLMDKARKDPGFKLYLEEQGYDVRRIP